MHARPRLSSPLGAPAGRIVALTTLALAAVFSFPAAPTASSAVTPVSYDRQVSTFAFLNTQLGPDALRTDETIQSDQGGVFDEQAVCHLEQVGSEALATADQTSEITDAGIEATFAGSAGGSVALPSHTAFAITSSGIVYVIQVDRATDCRISLDLSMHDLATFDLSIRVPNSGYLLQEQFFATEESYQQVVTLPAGTYQIAAGGGGDGGVGPNGSGSSLYSASLSISFEIAAAVADGGLRAPALLVSPNPARGSATIQLAGLASRSDPAGKTLIVQDAAGRRVRSLELPAVDASGSTRVTWDLRDDGGASLAPGVYFVRGQDGLAARCTILE